MKTTVKNIEILINAIYKDVRKYVKNENDIKKSNDIGVEIMEWFEHAIKQELSESIDIPAWSLDSIKSQLETHFKELSKTNDKFQALVLGNLGNYIEDVKKILYYISIKEKLANEKSWSSLRNAIKSYAPLAILLFWLNRAEFTSLQIIINNKLISDDDRSTDIISIELSNICISLLSIAIFHYDYIIINDFKDIFVRFKRLKNAYISIRSRHFEHPGYLSSPKNRIDPNENLKYITIIEDGFSKFFRDNITRVNIDTIKILDQHHLEKVTDLNADSKLYKIYHRILGLFTSELFSIYTEEICKLDIYPGIKNQFIYNLGVLLVKALGSVINTNSKRLHLYSNDIVYHYWQIYYLLTKLFRLSQDKTDPEIATLIDDILSFWSNDTLFHFGYAHKLMVMHNLASRLPPSESIFVGYLNESLNILSIDIPNSFKQYLWEKLIEFIAEFIKLIPKDIYKAYLQSHFNLVISMFHITSIVFRDIPLINIQDDLQSTFLLENSQLHFIMKKHPICINPS